MSLGHYTKRFLFLFGGAVREAGQQLDTLGCRIQGNYSFVEQLCKHRRIMPLFDKKPWVSEGTFIAPSASVIGQVKIGADSTIWYGAVLRGDVNNIEIGKNTTIGDRVVIHVSRNNPRGPLPTKVGDNVVVEQGAILHATTLDNECKIGMGSILYDGSHVESHAILSPGSVLTAGKRVPSKQVWAGNPAKFVRSATEEEVQEISALAKEYKQLAVKHQEEHEKTEADRQEDRDANFYDMEATARLLAERKNKAESETY